MFWVQSNIFLKWYMTQQMYMDVSRNSVYPLTDGGMVREIYPLDRRWFKRYVPLDWRWFKRYIPLDWRSGGSRDISPGLAVVQEIYPPWQTVGWFKRYIPLDRRRGGLRDISPFKPRKTPVFIGHPFKLTEEPVFIGHPFKLTEEPVFIGHSFKLTEEPVFIGHPFKLRKTPVIIGHNYFTLIATNGGCIVCDKCWK